MPVVRQTRRNGRQHLAALVRRFLRQLKRARKGSEKAIHGIRVGCRRLRVVLPLLAVDPESKSVRQVRRQLRKLLRTSGPCRDQDVCLALLEAQPMNGAAQRRELRSKLKRARRRAQKDLRTVLRRVDASRLRRLLRATLDKLVKDDQALARIATLQREQRRQVRGLHLTAGRRFDPEVLHAERKHLRRLHYAMELQESLLGHAAAATAILRSAQSQLGEIHDEWVLAQWLGRRTGAGSGRLHDQLLGTAREQHRIWLESKPVQRLESTFRARRAAR